MFLPTLEISLEDNAHLWRKSSDGSTCRSTWGLHFYFDTLASQQSRVGPWVQFQVIDGSRNRVLLNGTQGFHIPLVVRVHQETFSAKGLGQWKWHLWDLSICDVLNS